MTYMKTESAVAASLTFATAFLLSAAALAQGTAEQRSACIGEAFRFLWRGYSRCHQDRRMPGSEQELANSGLCRGIPAGRTNCIAPRALSKGLGRGWANPFCAGSLGCLDALVDELNQCVPNSFARVREWEVA
jgi:hypothetical protein